MIEPVVIEPDAIYDDSALYQAIGITPHALAVARRSGALKHTRKGRRTLYRGSWLLDWMEGGPAAPEASPTPGGGH